MIRKIIVAILIFIVGFVIAFFSESFFRGVIQDLYRWTTSNNIVFFGKNFYLFGSPLFHLGLAFTFVIFYLTNKIETQTFRNIALGILIFALTLITFSALDANIKIIQCTACSNGVRRLHWNDINYGHILGLSTILSVIPSLIKKLLKK